MKCPMCRGARSCPECDGLGAIVCETCAGKAGDCEQCHGEGRYACQPCDGSGACPRCKGEGEIEEP